MAIIGTILYYALLLYLLMLWARFILDLVRAFARQWRPRGVGLVIAEVIYALTDPPIRAVRRVVPPLRVGGAALDFAWSIVMLAVIILIYVALALTRVG
jgi:YggT family protein